MAETKEVLIEVKLDLKDVKTENYLKNWVNWMKCYVKIDAIECFPCYLKISFYHEDDLHREFPFSVIRLNIPGVRVGSAASRTKSHTYGIFWKSNRKRCRLFMAFPDKQSSSAHMEWLKRSIDALENYRKEILENHRFSRSILPGVLVDNSPADDKSFLNSTKSSLNDTVTERDMNDILGPLPDIPVSAAECSRWSTRRSSGCSGIYEEIMDSPQNIKRDKDAPRGSIVSAIYVDMTTPVHSIRSENTELPPPLPPRRRLNTPVYTPANSHMDANAKSRKSAWNIKNVFGRTKAAGAESQNPSSKKTTYEFTKSQTTSGISKISADDRDSNLLANCKNSFSTPDLTNVVDIACAKVPTTSAKAESDETDLDVMDIERSNSLNCSTNQFLCRPPPLNVSANILWSHNLSMTLSSSCDSSAINLVGANVNNPDSFLGHDMAGYCKMAPIIKNNAPASKVQPKLVRTSTTITAQVLEEHNQLMNSSSLYCTMAPILPSTSKRDDDKLMDLTKNITFDRHFEFDEECQLECSIKSNANTVAPNDETSSSGVSSDDGNVITNLNSTKPESVGDMSIDSHLPTDRNDDAISMTYTESPPQSARSNQFEETAFNFHSTKFDEKLPSYFPNDNTLNTLNSDITKYTVNNKNIKLIKNPITPSSKHINSAKKSNYKTVIKTPTSSKIQKLKIRRNSISETANPAEVPSNSYTNENWCFDTKRNDNRKYKTMPKQKTFEIKKVLSHLDPNTKFETQRQANFEKNSKITRATSSPRRIYNKCATMAIRLKTPPNTPIETTSNNNDSFNTSIDSNLRISNSDISSGGLIKSWARFRRIDFSPLKTKINSILQRTNSEF